MKPMQIRITIAAVACLLCAGCGDNWQAETQPVTGSVTVNGQPPTGALVHLYPVAERVDKRNSTPWGKVQPDGTFSLTTYEPDDGAPLGEYFFTIVWPEDSSKPSLFDRLGRRYAKPKQSKWRISVKEKSNVLPPIAITGAQVVMTPPRTPQKSMPVEAMPARKR
ncbi:MAG: hypothetical protein WD894_03190 [Pirellulales bacterium]